MFILKKNKIKTKEINKKCLTINIGDAIMSLMKGMFFFFACKNAR